MALFVVQYMKSHFFLFWTYCTWCFIIRISFDYLT